MSALEVKQEIQGLFQAIRDTILFHQELGLDPPPVKTGRLDRAESHVSASASFGLPIELTQSNTLASLKNFIGDCRRCKLHKSRTHLVFGEGSHEARLVFIGEGPGREEDRIGRPFVGESGRLLTKIIENGMGLTREQVYICNIVKCRPPRNREPEKDEMGTCISFLRQQLAIIKPHVICTLGRVAGQGLFGDDFRITNERGHWKEYAGMPVMPTYHPAYLLRNPAAKRQVWEDIKQIMARMGLEGTRT